MNIELKINPFIRFCDVIPNPCTSVGFVKAYDCRLFYIISGEGVFYIEDEIYHFSDNSLFLFPSGNKYKFYYNQSKNAEFYVIDFDYDYSNSSKTMAMSPKCIEDFDENILLQCPDNELLKKIYFIEYFPSIRTDLEEIREEFINKKRFYADKTSAILKDTIIEILRCADGAVDLKIPMPLISIKQYIDRNYDKKISSDLLSQEFGYHPYHINRLFKRYMGTTVYQYLVERRIKEAKKLLLRSENTIDRIAITVGMENQSNFTRLFKNSTGKTPTQYRHSHKYKIL